MSAKISKEIIIGKIKNIAISLNKDWLSVKDFTSHSDISIGPLIRIFGSCKNAFRSAGLKDNPNSKNAPVSKDHVIKSIRKIANILNKSWLSVDEFNQHADCSIGPLIKHFGSVTKAFKAAGLQENPNYTCSLTKDIITTDILRVSKILDVKSITVQNYLDHGSYSITTLTNHFGTVTQAFLASGLELVSNSTRCVGSKQDLIEDIKKIALLLDTNHLSLEDYRQYGNYSDGVLFKYFGNYTKAFDAAGLENHRYSIKITTDTIIQDLKQTAKFLNTDHLTMKIYGMYGRFACSTVCSNFPDKSWGEILSIAGLNSNVQFRGKDTKFYDSGAEADLANKLYSNYIDCMPHKQVCDDRKWKCDFYLPDKDLWIEYDGLEDRRRNPKKYQEKLDYYRTNNFNFIELHEGDDILEKCGLYIESKELLIQIITFSEANEFLARNHYLGNASRGAKYYGGFVADKLVGVIGLGKVANPKETSLAITRIAWLDIVRKDRNFGSRFISKTLKQSGYSGKIVSWSDPRFHSGTLYKACNFTEIKTKARTDYVYIDVDGNEFHKSYCRVPAGQSEPKYAESLGLVKIIVPPKQKWSITI
jgi:hypothetical protein